MIAGSSSARPHTHRNMPLAVALLLHAVAALVVLPAVHLALVHGRAVSSAEISDSGHTATGTLHQAGCPGCILVRAPGAPTPAVPRMAVGEAVVRCTPVSVSQSPTPLRSPPLGSRAPPLV